MHLVEYDKFHITYEIRAAVEHASQNFGGHYQTACFRRNLDVTCQDADIIEFISEISELLVAECFDRRGVDGFRHMFCREGNGRLGNHRLASGCMSCHE